MDYKEFVEELVKKTRKRQDSEWNFVQRMKKKHRIV